MDAINPKISPKITEQRVIANKLTKKIKWNHTKNSLSKRRWKKEEQGNKEHIGQREIK